MTQPPKRRVQRREEERPSAPVSITSEKKKRKSFSLLLLIIVFAALLGALVFFSPKTPSNRARYTAGNASGQVDQAMGGLDPYYSGLAISEIMPSNRSSVPDENGEYPDWVEVWNSSDRDINLYGVGLSDRGDSIRFIFPDYILGIGQRVIVFCSDTNRAQVGQPFHAKFKLSSTGETVYLFDPSAYTIDSVTYHIMGSDTSWARQDDGSYAETSAYSPGYPNTQEGHQTYRDATVASDGALVINEIMAAPRTGLTDEDGDLVDWVELRNTTDKPISLDNYALSNREDKPLKWHFPQGAVVPANGYYLVFCSGKDKVDTNGVPHSSFRISADHDTIVLSDNRGRLMDRVTIDILPTDCSYARQEDGTFRVERMATPSLSNTEDSAWNMDRYLRQWNKTGVYITEVLASSDTTVTPAQRNCDWIEIYNSSSNTFDLSMYGLSDSIGRPRKWQFPAGTMIAPGEYKLIYCDGNEAASTATELHTNFKVSRLGQETICLSDPTGRIIDKLEMPEMKTDVSYGRTQNLTGFFYYTAPTPTVTNGTGVRGFTQRPSFTVTPGMHYETVYAGFTIPEGTQVYYTTDGAIPTKESGILYEEGETVELKFTTVLRARAFSLVDLEPSDTVTGSYFINAYHTLPVVSLVCDPDELWNPTDGMLTVGPDVDKAKLPFKNTIYREFGKTPRVAYAEYYDTDGTVYFSQGVEMGLIGDFSLDMPQKSFKIRAKAALGSKTFQAALFEDRPYTEYKSLVLRNSGNDCAWTRMIDGLQSRLMDDYGVQVIHQAWKPVIVYLNGIYWGHMNLRERVDRYFVAQHEGYSIDEADQMTILKGNGTTEWGTGRSDYRDMIAKLKKMDPANKPADLQYMYDNIDLDNYIEYMAVEMFFGNSDTGNIRYYRLEMEGADHRWKWILYDLDYGLFSSKFNSPMSYTKDKGSGQMNIDNTILKKVLEVPELRAKFLEKLGSFFKFNTTERMLAKVDELYPIIQPEMNMHFNRWAGEHDQKVLSEWPTTPDGAYRYWDKRVSRLQNTMKLRPYYLWGFVRDELNVTNAEMLKYFGERPEIPADAIQ